MKIAFASKDSVTVNQHFGWCEKFYIYELSGEGFDFIEEADSSIEHQNEVDKLEYKIDCLGDSDIVYSSQIGPKAANMVQMAGIYPMKSSNDGEKIVDILQSIQKMINNNPPLWLKRILLKSSI